ncbi:MAG: hypothetical protein ACOCTT_04155 [archaeon]
MSEIKNKLREITVGKSPEFKSEIVEIDGQEFEMREPSVGTRGKIISGSGISFSQDGVDNDMNISQMQILVVVYCTYVPDTDEQVFSEKDIPMLLEQPAGSFVDKLAQVGMRLMNQQDEGDSKN